MPVIDVTEGPQPPSQDVCEAWATAADVTLDVETLAAIDADVLDDALLVASGILYNMTLQQWPGSCTEGPLRPTADYRSPDTMREHGLRVYDNGARWSCSCRGRDQYQPGCFHLSQIGLGEVPISGVVEVTIDGDVVDPARYKVDDYRWLVFLPDPTGADDRRGWPCCQRMELPLTELGTFGVTVTVGTGPDRGGVRAAASLAAELAKLWTPSLTGTCQLKGRVTSMTRQQVSMTVSDPSALLDRGLTGLVDVDLWVQGVLRAHRSRRAAVVIPERRRQKVRRTTS